MTSPVPARIRSGMDVCDVGGDKIGSVGEVHHVSQVADPATASVPDEIVEVKTGLLGLGKRLYVPMSAVQEVLAESIFLSSPKEELESRGYYEKPAHLSKVD
jgi:hypothetical protein